MKFTKFATGVAVAAGFALFAAGSALAIPYTGGSFSFSGATDTTTDVTTTNAFPLKNGGVITVTNSFGDFTSAALTTFTLTGAADLNDLTGFAFSDPVIGTFVVSSATRSGTVPGASATWDVEGTFTTGSMWDNPNVDLSANEVWVFSQAGGPGTGVSVSGTFNSPAVAPPVTTPEPATLAILGAGLAGIGALRRRKAKTA